MNEQTRSMAHIVDLVADALSIARPVGLSPSLDTAFQHKRDCESVADALAAHIPAFDRKGFMLKTGWNERHELEIPKRQSTE